MNREEILAKSRNEKQDEGVEQAENKGQRYGMYAFCLIFIFILLFSFFNGQSIYAPMSMFWAYLAAQSFPKYQFTKQSGYLISTIASGVAALGFLACFILQVLR